jgi:hypothetical protein
VLSSEKASSRTLYKRKKAGTVQNPAMHTALSQTSLFIEPVPIAVVVIGSNKGERLPQLGVRERPTASIALAESLGVRTIALDVVLRNGVAIGLRHRAFAARPSSAIAWTSAPE